jgi:UDP-N-acetylmuramoylalanine--D-glutamate ligase
VEGKYRDRPVLDPVDHLRLPRARDAQTSLNVHYRNKEIAVLGMGSSGEAAAELLLEEGANVTVIDTGTGVKLEERATALRARGVQVLTGDRALPIDRRFDLAIISPGIDPSAPLVRTFLQKRVEMIGELELAYEICRCPVVAITGTNGKTTTTQLIEKMLNACGQRTVACGNIGLPFSSIVRRSGELDVVTLEVSSFQLEKIRTFRPKVAVWLNLAPDHLDRYADVAEYRAAKLRIFENQKAEDFAVVNLRDDLPELAARKITFSAYERGGDFEWVDGAILFRGEKVLTLEATQLKGLHNAENLMAALGSGVALGLSFLAMVEALSTYRALPHRCEVVRQLDGVDWVNDSKATNLDALEKALMGEVRPVVLIAGGKDKGFEFDTITDLVANKVKCAVLIGQMAPRIEALWREKVRCVRAGSLAEAVQLARDEARPGDIVLFSPGTSSFDMFKNYEDRGNQFRALVQAITQ